MQNLIDIFSLPVSAAVTNNHCFHIRRDGQTELAWMAWLNIKTTYLQTVTHLTLLHIEQLHKFIDVQLSCIKSSSKFD